MQPMGSTSSNIADRTRVEAVVETLGAIDNHRESLGELAARIHSVDMTAAVGRHHALSAYLSASALGRALGQVVDLPAVMPDVEASEVAGRDSSAFRQE